MIFIFIIYIIQIIKLIVEYNETHKTVAQTDDPN